MSDSRSLPDEDDELAEQSGTRTSVTAFLGQRRAFVQATADVLCWLAALVLASALRLDLDLTDFRLDRFALAIPIVVDAQLLAGYVAGLYRGRWRFGSFEEVAALARATAFTTAVLFICNLIFTPQSLPRSAVLAGGVIALVMMGSVRYLWRLNIDRRLRPGEEGRGRLIVFGAGEAGAQVLTAIQRDPQSRYFPIALLDDDADKRNLRILGVPVRGDRTALPKVAAETDADTLLIAIPSAGGALVAELTEVARHRNLHVKVLPPVSELPGTDVGVADIRDVTEEDLLGRHQIETDVASIAGYLTGKRVLVTGAGGSIGSELCRQIVRFEPGELIMLDRDESGLHAVHLSIYHEALLDSDDLVIADIRDAETIRRLFCSRRPDVVFHAAALKHLPLLEQYPDEAVKTNVYGTLNVLNAARDVGVERFVNISTDKAANPMSVLGHTKRIAERITAHVAAAADGTYLSVRFGNVLGSRGSVLTTFRQQVEAGGPITVTDPDVTRYFMTVREAVQLVIQAGAIGRSGESLVLDMGEPVRIAEVAERLAATTDPPTPIAYTGLRAGEKMHEDLFGDGEPDVRPVHPLISHVAVPPLAIDLTEASDALLARYPR
jgi:FlaA1/EpsC-like NDP-sugar epimerase